MRIHDIVSNEQMQTHHTPLENKSYCSGFQIKILKLMFMKVSVFQSEKMLNPGRLHTQKFVTITFYALLALFFSLSVSAQNTIR
jgi:hypothetical protein